MIPGKLICLPFNLRKRTLLFWSSFVPYPHRNHYLLEISSLFIISLLFWRVLTHMFVSLNRHIVELHVSGVTGHVFLCTSFCLLSLMLPSSGQKCIPVVYPFHHCTFHCVGGRYHNWLIRSTTDGHSGCFQLWVIATVPLLHLLVHVSENFSQE